MSLPVKEPRKQCSTCGDWKRLDEFFKEKKKPMGVQSRCKICHTRGVKAWKQEAREKAHADEKSAEDAQKPVAGIVGAV